MLLRRLAVLVILAATAAAGSAGCADAAGPANIGTTRICTNCAGQAGDLSRFGYVTLHAWEYRLIPAIKRANPAAKVLVYKDMAYASDYNCHGGRDDELLPSGVGYCWALANHPDWFTLDAAGNRIEFRDYHGLWQMDVGSRAYQDQWLANVAAELHRYGWDGVTIDDANVDESVHVGSTRMREYPTQPEYAAASRSFLANVGPRLIADGFLVIPNIQAHPVLADAKLWADWIQFTSGGHREYWMKWGSGRDGLYGAGGWDDLEAVFDAVQRQGKIFLTTTTAPADDVRSMRWARASFLVGWNGGPSAFIFDPNAAIDPWSPEWTVDIGTPAGTRTRVAANAWRRDYTGGTAVVNASETASATVQLGGSYLTPESAPVTEVTLAPMTGLVLRLPPGAPPALPAASTPSPAAATTPGATPPPGATPAPARPTKPSRKARGTVRRLRGAVSLHVSPRVHGRVEGGQVRWRVTVYVRRARGWHTFASLRVGKDGRFHVHKQLRATRAVHLRAVARAGSAWASSRTLRVAPS